MLLTQRVAPGGLGICVAVVGLVLSYCLPCHLLRGVGTAHVAHDDATLHTYVAVARGRLASSCLFSLAISLLAYLSSRVSLPAYGTFGRNGERLK